ncbi:hypothetical protein K402DRAFT_343407 [Aulographum hederae CBS 113979]|uniref:Zn(2)-C6 fungal-type domain-containing protein n=1 Tax=Aulographum hederae CBS 113979 TaxID=1176131 RepID=A0A6G1GJ25_9PEZI|nr:hypothetical protein K402DRAFT_343407 [Aulographum hederae CBS 113979]
MPNKPKRKSHNKSRNGCQNCKARHVKCDEQGRDDGKPCANCVVRQTTSTCTYSGSRISHSTLQPPLLHQDSSGSRSSDDSSPKSSAINSHSASQFSLPQPSSLSPSPQFASRRQLELELLHRWSHSTYKCLSSVEEDNRYLQVDVPRGALSHPFLLDGMFSLAALETAACGRDDVHGRIIPLSPAESLMYIRAAMEYYDSASAGYRAALNDVSESTFHCVYIFSTMAAVINLTLPSYSTALPILNRIGSVLELMMGATLVAARNWNWMMNGPCSPSVQGALQVMNLAKKEDLDPNTAEALDRLVSVIESGGTLVMDPSMDLDMGMDNDAAQAARQSRRDTYLNAAKRLRGCFIVDAVRTPKALKGFCLAFPTYAGQDFADAFRDEEPDALFILMHWAVLLDRLGKEAWWAATVGRDLVREISDLLVNVHSWLLIALPGWQEGIDWSRREVGLPPMGY